MVNPVIKVDYKPNKELLAQRTEQDIFGSIANIRASLEAMNRLSSGVIASSDRALRLSGGRFSLSPNWESNRGLAILDNILMTDVGILYGPIGREIASPGNFILHTTGRTVTKPYLSLLIDALKSQLEGWLFDDRKVLLARNASLARRQHVERSKSAYYYGSIDKIEFTHHRPPEMQANEELFLQDEYFTIIHNSENNTATLSGTIWDRVSGKKAVVSFIYKLQEIEANRSTRRANRNFSKKYKIIGHEAKVEPVADTPLGVNALYEPEIKRITNLIAQMCSYFYPNDNQSVPLLLLEYNRKLVQAYNDADRRITSGREPEYVPITEQNPFTVDALEEERRLAREAAEQQISNQFMRMSTAAYSRGVVYPVVPDIVHDLDQINSQRSSWQ